MKKKGDDSESEDEDDNEIGKRNQAEKSEKIGPVIFFKVHEKPVKDKIEEYLIENVKDVKIEEFKLTANNNVLIYTKSNDDNVKLVENSELFPGSGRLNLHTVDKRPYLLIRNVTYEFLSDKMNELRAYGILDIYEMNNKATGRSYKFVKALIVNEESKQALLNERFIRIGLSKIYIEDFVKPPSQCRKCKAFGHIELFCKSKLMCGKCGDNHKDEECKEENKINSCLNCKKEHSTYYRGCSVYLEAKNDKLQKIHKKHIVVSNEINSVGSTFRRTYSTATNNDDLINKFKSMLETNNELLVKNTTSIIKQELSEMQKSIDKIMAHIKTNNLKLVYFVIDSIKALVPKIQFSKSNLRIIQDSFSQHQLGKIEIDRLTSYYCPERNINHLKMSNQNVSDDEAYFPKND